MRNKDSKPVYHNSGTIFDPPESPKRVTRNYHCRHTGDTKTLVKNVYFTKGHGGEAGVRRTSLVSRTPVAPTDSVGFTTLEIRRAEAEERNAVCAARSPAERIARLDRLFGKGLGAKKERARLTRISIQAVSNQTPTANAVGVKLTPAEKAVRATANKAAKAAVRNRE